MDNSLKAVEINAHTLSKIMKLSVTEAQRKNVAPNSVTIAQNAYEPAGRARGLWHRAPPVRLIAMITAHQGKGYGHQALQIAFANAREWGMPRFHTSCVPEDASPQGFYEKHGLRPTGRIVDGEVEMMGPTPAAADQA